MTLAEWVAALEARGCKPRKAAGGYDALCPAHEEKVPSFHVEQGDTAEIVATCHVGCTFEEIVAALGLVDGPVDSFEARIAATYDYVDETGRLLYQAVRLRDPKDFRQRRPDGDGWAWSLGDVRRVLYRLPAVREAAEARRAVMIPEGEKDVEALEAIGFVATCSPMGASKNEDAPKWRDEYTESLRGVACVFVVSDCDSPGRAHARATCASCHAVGIPAYLIDIAPDRDDGYDSADFILEHGDQSRARLEHLARIAPRWPVAPKATLPIVSWTDFSASVGPYDDSRDYLGGLLRGGQRTHVIGPIGHGKTTFLAEAVACAVHGRDFLGFQGRGGIRGIYIDLEMPPELLKETLDAARFDAASDCLDVVNLPDGLEVDVNEKHREMIESAMGEYQVVAIDPWYKLIAEELSEGMRRARTVISFLDGLRERYPRTAVVVGFHANEPQRGQRLQGLGDASGYKVFQRPADTAVLFERIRGDRSRVVWAKTRSSRLPKMGEVWEVEWSRGSGFQRSEFRPTHLRIYDALPPGWNNIYALAEALEMERTRLSRHLNVLYDLGLVEQRTPQRGRAKEWQKVDEAQERLAA